MNNLKYTIELDAREEDNPLHFNDRILFITLAKYRLSIWIFIYLCVKFKLEN